jgi:hypothetical protein
MMVSDFYGMWKKIFHAVLLYKKHVRKQMTKGTKLRIHNTIAKAIWKFSSEVSVLTERDEQRLEAARMKF